MKSTNRKSAGFTLIEVLVALVVLSIGILGVATLQITTKRSNFEAVQRSTATQLVHDMIERMRANGVELATYTNGGVGRTLTGATIGGATDCTAADCTAAELAVYDLSEWEDAISGIAEQSGGSNRSDLTLATACLSGPNGGSGTYTIALAWRGLTKLSNPGINACGEASGLYDNPPDGAAGDDVYRRILIVETFIAESL